MADDEDEYREPPDFMYELQGGFNPDTYDDDCRDFPDYFDDNGWPLFGEYDPYALAHPITGLSWRHNPRIPVSDETDLNYDGWFELLTIYEATRWQFTKLGKRKPKVSRNEPAKRQYNSASGVVLSVQENLHYLRSDVYPYLNKMFEERSSSPEFLLLWGEFCRIAENIGVSAQRRGKGDRLDGQLKWYLHWQRYQNEKLKVSRIVANRSFIEVAWNIVDRGAQCPAGFDITWFKQALGQSLDKPDKSIKPVRQLPNSLKRAYVNRKKADQLLASDPNDSPKIPPIDPSSYK